MKSALLLRKLRNEFWPTPQQMMLKQWIADGGDEKFRFNYESVGSDSQIVDIGGYHGQWTSDMIARYGCRSIVVEPIPDYAEFIKQRFVYNDRVTVMECALGSETRNLEIDFDGVDSTEFTDKPDLAVDMIDAGLFFKRNVAESVAAVSMNCEGGEYEILPRLIDLGEIRKIQELEVQFHDFVPHAKEKRRAIRRALAITHEEVYCYPFIWEHWRRKCVRIVH